MINTNRDPIMDWRNQLKVNARRVNCVLASFVMIYMAVGLLFDIYLSHTLYQCSPGESLLLLLSWRITPIATLILVIIAILSILITLAFYDRIMLLGTQYCTINSHSQSMEERQLYNIVEELKIAAGLRYTPKIYVIDADYMNAFASGYSEKSALIAVTRGLLKKLERGELQAVIAHELSHIKHGDIKLTLVASVLSNLSIIVLDVLLRSIIFSSPRRRTKNNSSGALLFLAVTLLRYLLPVITMLLILYLSRRREFMADAGAVELTRDNQQLANALIKISGDFKEHLDNYRTVYRQTFHEEVRRAAYIFDPKQEGVTLQQSINNLFSTHPSLKDRLKALGIPRR